MIKIARADCPPVLQNASSEGKHYNKKKVVKVLWEMQHEKCCYCEQKIPHEGHLKAVEHFKPQSIFQDLKNDWKNLLLACTQCNGKKSAKFPVELTDESGEPKVIYLKTESGGKPLIIDPSDPNIDPEEHIDFIVDDSEGLHGIVKARCNSNLGLLTIKVVDLTSIFYTKQRRNYYYSLMMEYRNLLKAMDENNDTELESCKRYFRMLISAKGKFAAFVRAFAKSKNLNKRFGIDIPVGAET
jgi:uncharacterized protein (TIGR02646 family)